MDRRHFIRLGLLGAITSTTALRLLCASKPVGIFRVTVLRRVVFGDIQALYSSDPESGPCPVLSEGNTVQFALEGGLETRSMPCDKACRSILAAAREMAESQEITRIINCGDGCRPVVFKIERL